MICSGGEYLRRTRRAAVEGSISGTVGLSPLHSRRVSCPPLQPGSDRNVLGFSLEQTHLHNIHTCPTIKQSKRPQHAPTPHEHMEWDNNTCTPPPHVSSKQ